MRKSWLIHVKKNKWFLPQLALFLFLALTGIVSPGESVQEPPQELSAYPWVYLRDGQPLEPGEKAVELVAVGDIMLGRGVMGEKDIFAATPWLRTAGLALGNLECAIATENISTSYEGKTAGPGQPYLLVAPASAVEPLSRAGFDLLGMANNHALDRGLEGLEDTARSLEAAGIRPLGAAPDRDGAYSGALLESGGLKLAFLAFNAVPSPRGLEWSGEVRNAGPGSGWALAGWDRERATAALRLARSQVDAVIVSIHWGYEYDNRVDPAQREIAQELVAAGADLVTGHHPHVVQAVESLPGAAGTGQALVAYSLGNFVFDQGFGETGQGLALKAFFDQQGLRGVQALPVHAGSRPALMDPEKAEELFERIAPKSERTAWRCSRQTCLPTEAPPANLTGRFHTGAADLTGDGDSERVALEAGRVTIKGAHLRGWESPTEWQVNDLAAGDPNRDGRQELLLALQKADPSGVLLSHPYVLGFRKGQFRLLWGGSAVGDPILEVEVGDLDGDGLQELAVLEALHDGTGQAASVWRWNGWGFSQVWRSEPGRYTNLRLVEAAEGIGTLIVVDETNNR